MNEYIRKLGFQTTEYEFHDLFSIEEWAQAMI